VLGKEHPETVVVYNNIEYVKKKIEESNNENDAS